MKEEQVKDIVLKNHMDFAEHATIYGTVSASAAAYRNGLGLMMHVMKDHVLHFNDNGILVFAVDDMRGILKEDTLVHIPKERIRSVVIKMKLFTFLMIIRTDDGDIRYKIRRSAIGAPWHKVNLSYLLLRLA